MERSKKKKRKDDSQKLLGNNELGAMLNSLSDQNLGRRSSRVNVKIKQERPKTHQKRQKDRSLSSLVETEMKLSATGKGVNGRRSKPASPAPGKGQGSRSGTPATKLAPIRRGGGMDGTRASHSSAPPPVQMDEFSKRRMIREEAIEIRKRASKLYNDYEKYERQELMAVADWENEWEPASLKGTLVDSMKKNKDNLITLVVDQDKLGMQKHEIIQGLNTWLEYETKSASVISSLDPNLEEEMSEMMDSAKESVMDFTANVVESMDQMQHYFQKATDLYKEDMKKAKRTEKERNSTAESLELSRKAVLKLEEEIQKLLAVKTDLKEAGEKSRAKLFRIEVMWNKERSDWQREKASFEQKIEMLSRMLDQMDLKVRIQEQVSREAHLKEAAKNMKVEKPEPQAHGGLQEMMKIMQKEKDELQAKINLLEAKLADRSAKLAEVEEKLLNATANAKKEMQSANTKMIEAHKAQVEALEEKIARLEADIENLQRRSSVDIKSKDLIADSLRQELEDLRRQMEFEMSRMETSNSGETKELQDQVNALEEKLSKNEELLEEKDKELAELKKKLKFFEKASQEGSEALQKEVEELREELERLRQKSAEALLEEQTKLKAELEANQRDAEALIAKKDEELSEAKNRIAELEARIKELEEKNSSAPVVIESESESEAEDEELNWEEILGEAEVQFQQELAQRMGDIADDSSLATDAPPSLYSDEGNGNELASHRSSLSQHEVDEVRKEVDKSVQQSASGMFGVLRSIARFRRPVTRMRQETEANLKLEDKASEEKEETPAPTRPARQTSRGKSPGTKGSGKRTKKMADKPASKPSSAEAEDRTSALSPTRKKRKKKVLHQDSSAEEQQHIIRENLQRMTKLYAGVLDQIAKMQANVKEMDRRLKSKYKDLLVKIALNSPEEHLEKVKELVETAKKGHHLEYDFQTLHQELTDLCLETQIEEVQVEKQIDTSDKVVMTDPVEIAEPDSPPAPPEPIISEQELETLQAKLKDLNEKQFNLAEELEEAEQRKRELAAENGMLQRRTAELSNALDKAKQFTRKQVLQDESGNAKEVLSSLEKALGGDGNAKKAGGVNKLKKALGAFGKANMLKKKKSADSKEEDSNKPNTKRRISIAPQPRPRTSSKHSASRPGTSDGRQKPSRPGTSSSSRKKSNKSNASESKSNRSTPSQKKKEPLPVANTTEEVPSPRPWTRAASFDEEDIPGDEMLEVQRTDSKVQIMERDKSLVKQSSFSSVPVDDEANTVTMETSLEENTPQMKMPVTSAQQARRQSTFKSDIIVTEPSQDETSVAGATFEGSVATKLAAHSVTQNQTDDKTISSPDVGLESPMQSPQAFDATMKSDRPTLVIERQESEQTTNTEGSYSDEYEEEEIDLNFDTEEFEPQNDSLNALSYSLAKVRDAMETTERALDRNPDDDLAQEWVEYLTARDEELFEDIQEWGVEACASIMSEMEQTLIKQKAMMAWAKSMPGKGALGDSTDKFTTLSNQKEVMKTSIDALGGWEAAVFLDSGDVNVDVNLEVWPKDDKLEMLSAMREYLLQKLEDEREASMKAQADLLAKLKEGNGAKDEEIKRLKQLLTVQAETVDMLKGKLERQSKIQQMPVKKKVDPLKAGVDGAMNAGSGAPEGGWPLDQLSAERKTIAKLRQNIASVVHQIVEVCQPSADAKMKSSLEASQQEVHRKASLRISFSKPNRKVVTSINLGDTAGPKQEVAKGEFTIEQSRTRSRSKTRESDAEEEDCSGEPGNAKSQELSVMQAIELLDRSKLYIQATDTFSKMIQVPGKKPEDMMKTEDVVVQLNSDTVWLRKLLQIVKLKIHEAISETESGLAKKEEEIMLITEKNLHLQKQLNSLKSAYESADQEDTIIHLRQNLLEQESQQLFLQKRIDALQKSSETHSGALEVFEKMVERDGLLREIIAGLNFKKMELNLKLQTLDKQLQGNQQLKEKKRKAYEFLKTKLEKEEKALGHRISTAEQEKEQADQVIIDFFERLNRATAAIFNDSGGSVQSLMRWAQKGTGALASPASTGILSSPDLYKDIESIGKTNPFSPSATAGHFSHSTSLDSALHQEEVKKLLKKDLRKFSSVDPILTPIRSSLTTPSAKGKALRKTSQNLPTFGEFPINMSMVGRVADTREVKENVLFLNRGFPLRSAAPTPNVKFRKNKR